MFPFIHQDQFQEKAQSLKQALSVIKPFTVRLEVFQHFAHAKKCVMWLQPIDTETNDSTRVKEVYSIVEQEFPWCADKTRDFTPHLTLGQFGKKDVERKKTEFKKNWTTIEFEVNEIYFLSRAGQTSPMEIRERVPLGQQ